MVIGEPAWEAGGSARRCPTLLSRRWPVVSLLEWTPARSKGTTSPPSSATIQRIGRIDRKSTRLNSSHRWIAYGVFCFERAHVAHGSVCHGHSSCRGSARGYRRHRQPAHGLFFNDTAATEIYPLSLHDALLI